MKKRNVILVGILGFSYGPVGAAPVDIGMDFDAEPLALFSKLKLKPPIGSEINRQQISQDPTNYVWAVPPGATSTPISTPAIQYISIPGGGDDDSVNALASLTNAGEADLSYTAWAVSGREPNYEFTGSTQLTFSVTNASSVPQFVSYTGTLSGMSIAIEFGQANDADNPLENTDLKGATGVGLKHNFSGDGIDDYSAEYEFWTHSQGLDLVYKEGKKENLSASLVEPILYGGFLVGHRAVLNDLTYTVDLGLFDAGETKEFDSVMEMVAVQAAFETRINALMSDPSSLATRFTITPSNSLDDATSTVSSPSAALMLFAGIGALLLRRPVKMTNSASLR